MWIRTGQKYATHLVDVQPLVEGDKWITACGLVYAQGHNVKKLSHPLKLIQCARCRKSFLKRRSS